MVGIERENIGVDTEYRLYELMEEIEQLSSLLDMIKDKFAELFNEVVTRSSQTNSTYYNALNNGEF